MLTSIVSHHYSNHYSPSLILPSGFWLLLLFNSFLAYFVNLTNFLVTKYTSALTLQVLGNAKGVVAVVISVLCFKNPVTFYSMLGYAITVGGVVLYSQAKKASKKQEALRKMNLKSPTSTVDLEQPRSPFGATAEANSRMSSETLSRNLSGLLSSESSDRIMARGYSSIFEAYTMELSLTMAYALFSLIENFIHHSLYRLETSFKN